jgi:hypothetical protein
MIRRYIVEDSEVQQLCQKIYVSHKEAIDLIVEYKPDRQKEVSDFLIDMIKSDPDLILDDSSKAYIRLYPKI